MSLISERQRVSDIVSVAVGFPVHALVPNRINAPTGMVIPGSPYLLPGDTYGRGRFKATYDVVLVSQGKTNETSAPAMDEAVEDALVGLVNEGYGIEQVSNPYALESSGAQYLATTIQISIQITL